MDNKPEATIAIPAYNAEKFIHNTLDSALRQNTGFDYEVLVIDDGSEDKTKEILNYYQKENKDKLRVLNQDNRGIGNTRNRILRESRGNVLLGLDSDDILHSSALEKTLDSFGNNTHMVYSDHEEIDEKGNYLTELRKFGLHNYFDDIIFHFCFPGHLRAFNMNHVRNKKFRTDIDSIEDYDFLLNVVCSYWPNHEIKHIPQTLYSYRKNSAGLTESTHESKEPEKVVQGYLNDNLFYGSKNVEVFKTFYTDNYSYYTQSAESFAHYLHGNNLKMNPFAEEAMIEFFEDVKKRSKS